MMMALVQLWNKSTTTVPLLLLRGLSLSRISQQQPRDYSSSSGGPPISNDEVKALFEEWAMKCNRVYKTLKEKERRFKVFKKTVDEVKKHNFPGDSPFKLGLNCLADWTDAEHRACMLKPKRKRRPLVRVTMTQMSCAAKTGKPPVHYVIGQDGEPFVLEPLVHQGLRGDAAEVEMPYVAEAEGSDAEWEVKMADPDPNVMQCPPHIYHAIKLPSEVRADLQRAGAEASESRQWRQQTNEVLRWLVAGQHEIYRRLEMQPRVSPLIPPSTQEVGTSTQQAGTSLQQPPLDDSQL